MALAHTDHLRDCAHDFGVSRFLEWRLREGFGALGSGICASDCGHPQACVGEKAMDWLVLFYVACGLVWLGILMSDGQYKNDEAGLWWCLLLSAIWPVSFFVSIGMMIGRGGR